MGCEAEAAALYGVFEWLREQTISMSKRRGLLELTRTRHGISALQKCLRDSRLDNVQCCSRSQAQILKERKGNICIFYKTQRKI